MEQYRTNSKKATKRHVSKAKARERKEWLDGECEPEIKHKKSYAE